MEHLLTKGTYYIGDPAYLIKKIKKAINLLQNFGICFIKI